RGDGRGTGRALRLGRRRRTRDQPAAPRGPGRGRRRPGARPHAPGGDALRGRSPPERHAARVPRAARGRRAARARVPLRGERGRQRPLRRQGRGRGEPHSREPGRRQRAGAAHRRAPPGLATHARARMARVARAGPLAVPAGPRAGHAAPLGVVGMARNVEVKARVSDLAVVEARARSIADREPVDLTQDDTFFACPRGRLKLRELSPEQGELIFYVRPDVPGPKVSEFFIARTPSPQAMRETLGRALGIIGRVRKRRRLYLVENTRIHLDQVEGLGSFLELEVVLSEPQTAADGEAVALRLLPALGISEADLIRGAYVDLLRDDH